METAKIEVERTHWTPKEVASLCNVSVTALFIYEKKLGICTPRDPHSHRRYSKQDVERLRLAFQLSKYFHLRGLKAIIDEGRFEAFAWMIEPTRERK